MATTVDTRDEYRETLRARLMKQLPSWYSPWLHLGATVGSGLITLAVSLFFIHDLRAWELLVVPAMFLVSNGAEWRAHKTLLHRRMIPFHVLYDRHTPEHHVVFPAHDMAIRETRELRLVLIPAVGVLTIVIATAPFAWLAGHYISMNAGWLVLSSAAMYVVLYELSHASYHLPLEHWVSRIGFIKVLREHHRRHHHPELMQRYNFNVTIPLFDWVHGTNAPPELVQRLLEDKAPVSETHAAGRAVRSE